MTLLDYPPTGAPPGVSGPQVPVDHVLDALARGTPLRQLLATYPFLTGEHLRAALDWRAQHPPQQCRLSIILSRCLRHLPRKPH
jgi:uncharacterized protein (DUF433 family)